MKLLMRHMEKRYKIEHKPAIFIQKDTRIVNKLELIKHTPCGHTVLGHIIAWTIGETIARILNEIHGTTRMRNCIRHAGIPRLAGISRHDGTSKLAGTSRLAGIPSHPGMSRQDRRKIELTIE